MSGSYNEVFYAIPKKSRTSRFQVLASLFALGAVRKETAVESSAVAKTLKLHHRGAAPKNVPDVLRKSSPDVEASQTPGGLRWSLTGAGLRRLADVAGIDAAAALNGDPSLDLSSLHPRIRGTAEPLVRSSHFAEAVGRAAKELNQFVRTRSSRSADEGTKMMHQVFSRDENAGKRLVLLPLATEWERDRQDGFRMLMAGVQLGIANVDKHGKLDIPNATVALEALAMLSYLARLIESAEVVGPALN